MRFLVPISLVTVAALALAASAKADTIGNPAVYASTIDTCAGCDYILNQTFATAGETVTSYQFYALQSGDITPVLFSEATVGGDAIFTVTGVGTSETVAASATPYTFSFGLTSGSALTGAGTYFGFFSETPTVGFSYNGTPGNFFGNPGDTTVGTSFDAGQASTYMTDSLNGLNGREYSINASATPEPSSLSLMGLGLAGVSALLRRRRSA